MKNTEFIITAEAVFLRAQFLNEKVRSIIE